MERKNVRVNNKKAKPPAPKSFNNSIVRISNSSPLKYKSLGKPHGSPDRVPVTNSDPIVKISRLFQATGAVNGAWTLQSGIIQFMVASSVNLVIPAINMYRIKRIRMWSNIGGSGNEGYCELTPMAEDTSLNNFNSPPKTYVDSTNSTTYTAHLDVKFNVDTPSGSWHQTATINTGQLLFQIICSSNTTIMVDFEVLFGFSQVPNNFSQAVSSATPYSWYARQPVTNLMPFGVNYI